MTLLITTNEECPSLCNHEERLKFLEFAVKQTDLAQVLQKENAELKTELAKTQSELVSCRADMVDGRDKYGEALPKGKLALTLPKLYKTWSVKFDIKPLRTVGATASVLHVTTGDNCCDAGSRNPGIWLNKLSSSLYVVATANGAIKGADYPPIPMHEWTTIEVFQSKMSDSSGRYIIKVAINAKEHVLTINSDPQEFDNVLVYNADPWYDAGAALTRNLEIHTNRN